MSLPPEQGVAEILEEEKLVNKNNWSKIEIFYYEDENLGKLSCAYNNNYATILKVEVEEDYQRQSIGTSLMERACEELRKENVEHVYTVVANRDGEGFVKANNFTKDSPVSKLRGDPSIFYKKL